MTIWIEAWEWVEQYGEVDPCSRRLVGFGLVVVVNVNLQ